MPANPPLPRIPAPSAAHAVPSPPRSPLVTVAVWLMLVLSVAGAVAAAVAQRSSVRSEDRAAFRATSGDVAASMASAIRRDIDFIATLRSTVAKWPTMTNAQFAGWIASTGALTRYPGGMGYAFVAHVPAAQLDRFAAQLMADPPLGAILPSGPFAVIPAGGQAEYCLVRLAVTPSMMLPLGLDMCATGIPGVVSQAQRSTAARDTGEIALTSLDATGGLFAAVAPVYRGGRTPATVVGRRAAFLGWAIGTFDGKAIIAAAGGVRPGLQVQIGHRNPGARPVTVVTEGSAGADPQVRVTPVSADGSWTVRVTGSTSRSGLGPNGQFWIILLGGLALSGLLFGFVGVLARGRGRALHLVARKTDELQHLALHDSLTGLPNRALILDRIEQALARARRSNDAVAVMFLDLDGFKTVNDTFGHAIGDELLRAVGARLSGTLRDSDAVGRLGGDEFVILAEGDSLDAGPETIAERIREVLDEPFRLGADQDLVVQTQVSIGIAIGVRASADDLLRDADIALYEAKETGRNRFVLFAPEMQTVIAQRRELEADLRQAVADDQFFVVYQPTFELRTQAITGVEALVRWQHPTRGVVMPDEFITLAEETGVIVALGRLVLSEACRQAAEWQRQGRALPVSVNVSGRQLDGEGDFVATVEQALADTGLDPGSLTLEITETMLMHDATASATRLHSLKALGVRIAVDDFGTGYSSLAYLQQFPVDVLKIDRSFIAALGDNSESAALIHTLIQLGKALKIETLAEGIEGPDQLARLQREDCDSGQGYLVARPLSAEALHELIDSRPEALAARPVR